MELKEPNASRLVGGAKMWNGLAPHPHVIDKYLGGYLRREEFQSHTRPQIQGSSVRKISPHNFWLQKPVGIEPVAETAGAPSGSFYTTHT